MEIGFSNMEDLINEMEEYAKDNNVPIMNEEGINFLLDYIKNNSIKRILEIGTAIGYSAIRMCSVNQNIKVTTIERDEKRYLEAVKNVNKASLIDRINLLFGDALEIDVNGEFDLIFIDAAKAQNIKFFERFQKNLSEGGTIITDNMNFHGLVFEKDSSKLSRNLRQLVRKVNNYKTFLEENDNYSTSFYDVGDGIAVSIKNSN